MRWLFRILGIVVVLVVLAIGALFLIPSERIARIATDQFTAQTGRDLAIAGAVRPTLWPQLGVRIEGVTLANADWSEQGAMLSAERLAVGVNLMALMGGAVEVERLELIGPQILLERAADGRANWEFGAAAAPGDSAAQTSNEVGESNSDAGSGLPSISLGLAEIRDGSLTYVDHGANIVQRITALDLEARLPSMDARAVLNGSALYNGAALEFDAAIETPAQLLSGALGQIEATLRAGGTEVSVAGRGGISPLGFAGTLAVDSGERAQLFQSLGQAAPDLPRGLGRERITLNADLTLASEGSVHLRQTVLGLDGNRITGDIDAFIDGPRPRVVANLAAQGLDLVGLSQQGRVADGEADAAAAPAAGWSRDPIDVSALRSVDVDVTVTTGVIELGDARLERISARARLDDGRMVVTLNPVQLYGGQITGEVIVNGRGGLSSRVNVALAGLQMQPLLTQFVDYDRLVGTAEGSVNILAVGGSLDALMRSLSGEGRLNMGQGEILGLDLGGMLRNLDASYRGEGAKTIFDGISASFTVVDGILNNQDLNFAAPLLTATGAGAVNIGAQTVDYRVTPVALADESGSGISVPVLISGSWWDLSFRPDLAFLVDERLEEERRALQERARAEAAAAEDRARAAAAERLAEELDVDTDALSSRDAVEEAVRDRLQQEIGGALQGILGGN